MPRGRHRGRRTRRHTKNTQWSKSPIKQDMNELTDIENSSPTQKYVEKVSDLQKKTEFKKNVSNSNKGKKKKVINSKPTANESSRNTEKGSDTKTSFVSRLCWCGPESRTKYLAETPDDNSTKTKTLETATVKEINPHATSKQQPDVEDQDVRKFSFLKKKKTPHGKVEIYSTDQLDDSEDARITGEAIQLLKHVKNITKEKDERKDKTSGTDSVFTRIRKLFRN